MEAVTLLEDAAETPIIENDFRRFLLNAKDDSRRPWFNYEDEPLHSIIENLGEPDFRNALLKNGEFRKRVANLLSHFYYRLTTLRDLPASYHAQCLLVRRRLQIYWLYPAVRGPEMLHELLMMPYPRIPPPWGALNSIELRHVDSELVGRFLADYARFKTFAPWHSSISNSVREHEKLEQEWAEERGMRQWITFSQKTNNYEVLGAKPDCLRVNNRQTFHGPLAERLSVLCSINNMLAVSSAQLIRVLMIIRLIHQGDLSGLTPTAQAVSLVADLAAEYGIAPHHALDLGFNPESSNFGWIDEQCFLHIKIGSAYFSDAVGAFEEGILAVPLHFKCQELIRSLGRRSPVEHLAGWLGPTPLCTFRETLADLLQVKVVSRRTFFGLERSFYYVGALFGEKYSLPELSFLAAHPLPGQRGPCCYECARESRLHAIGSTIRENLRRMADVQVEEEPPLLRKDDPLLGSPSLTPEANWNEIRELVRLAVTPAELAATTQRIFYAHGHRVRSIHRHPGSVFEDDPAGSFACGEKQVQGRLRHRKVVGARGMRTLFDAWGKSREELLHLPYCHDEATLRWQDLPLAERHRLRRFLLGSQPLNGNRRTFIRMFRQEGLKQVATEAMVGQGASTFQIGGVHTLFSPVWFYEKIQTFMDRQACRLKMNEAFEELAVKVKQTGLNSLPSKPIATERLEDVSSSEALDFLLGDWKISKPTRKELRQYGRLMDHFHASVDPLTDEDLRGLSCIGLEKLLILALVDECHLPVSNILSFAPYYTCNSIFQTEGHACLRVPIRQDDTGLGWLPLEIQSPVSGGSSLSVRLFRAIRQRFADMKMGGAEQTGDIIRWRLFMHLKLTPLFVGKLAGHFLKGARQRSRLAPLEAYRILQQGSRYGAFMHHPGVAAGAAANKLLTALNFFNLPDVLSARYEHRATLTTVDGRPYHDEFAPTEKDFRREAHLQILFGNPEKTKPRGHPPALHPRFQTFGAMDQWNRGQWFEFFAYYLPTATHDKVKSFLLRHKTGSDDRLASRQAAGLMRRFRHCGRLKTSKPLPLFSLDEMRRIITAAREVAVPNRSTFKWLSSFGETEGREAIHELYCFFLLAAVSGARPGELCLLRGNHIEICGEETVIHIFSGKSVAAKRSIHLGLNAFVRPHLAELIPYLQRQSAQPWSIWPLLTKRFHAFSVDLSHPEERNIHEHLGRFFQLSVVRALGDPSRAQNVSAYTIRHEFVFTAIQTAIESQFWHGNFNTYLATLADQTGHSCFTVTLFSYLGVAAMALKWPDPILRE